MSAIIKPPFTFASATKKVLVAQNLWNTCNPEKVGAAYTSNSKWRNREKFVQGTAEIVQFLTEKWKRELDYKLKKELFCFNDNLIAVHFQYEYHNEEGQWFRAYGNEHWTFNSDGLMNTRDASINDLPIKETERILK